MTDSCTVVRIANSNIPIGELFSCNIRNIRHCNSAAIRISAQLSIVIIYIIIIIRWCMDSEY